jgi:xanthine dehydrogenase large subunit
MPDDARKSASHRIATPLIANPARTGVGVPRWHESGPRHVTGAAVYLDDMREPEGLLHTYVRLSDRAHATITKLDVSACCLAPGVHAVLTADDIDPQLNDVGPALPGDPIFAPGIVRYDGQALFAVAAETEALARAAAQRAIIDYDDLPALFDIADAVAQDATVSPPLTMRKGDAATAIAAAPHRHQGEFRMGGQDHFYLEGHIALAVPGEEGEIKIYSSTQHPTEVQHLVARTLGVPDHNVVCEVRRMGGGFGGKESQASQVAVTAALLAVKTGRPVKWCLNRDDDMRMTGKRHGFLVRYQVGYDDDGRILGYETDLYGNCGHSPDLSNAIVDRAMFHAGNCYHLPAARVTGHRSMTHTVSNTAFRGFGGPQGMLAAENMIDDVARLVRQEPLSVRRRNFFDPGAGRNITHYGQVVNDFVLPQMVNDLVASAGYAARREAVDAFNANQRYFKRGIAVTPVQYGISFTLRHLNQAGALVHVYADGSVMLNHGGTEMGQGLFTKVAQVVAEVFKLEVTRIKVTATDTSKVPNTAPTAASSGSDLNGMAAKAAAQTIQERMAIHAAKLFGVEASDVRFEPNRITAGEQSLNFQQLAKACHEARISLSSTGFYRTPLIHFDRTTAQGRPFYYYAYGVACAEVLVDCLTGEYRVERADLLHDVGQSLNPAIDQGQIEGAFIQGMGWLTTEELCWNEQGKLTTHAPSTYKIPTCRDLPPVFNVRLFDNENRQETIFRSKAVGEPPFMLANAVFLALKDAVAATHPKGSAVRLDAPATPERVLLALG